MFLDATTGRLSYNANKVTRYLIFALLLFILPSFVEAIELTNPSSMLVGVFVNQEEVDSVDILKQENEYWISLDDLAEFTGIRMEKEEGLVKFFTPIGKASLAIDKIGEYEGKLYMSGARLMEVLSVKLLFSRLDFALFLDVPWRPGSPVVGDDNGKHGPVVKPDIRAPAGSLSFIRSNSEYTDEKETESSDDWSSSLDTGGRILGGSWLLGADGQNGDDPILNRYSWSRVGERSALRIGSNYVDLNTLLQNYNYTGVQWAFDNRGIERYTDFDTNLNLESFLAEDIATQQDIIRDDGPPGGIAELRINDHPIARVRIGLNGHYEFRNVQRTRGGFQTIKIFIYKRSLGEIPMAVLDFTRSVALQTLPEGEFFMRIGAGEMGNSLKSDTHDTNDVAAGFFKGRYGISDRLTFLAIAQNGADDKPESLTGIRLSVGDHWNWAMDIGLSENALAYSSEWHGLDRGWEFRLLNRYFDPGFSGDTEQEEYENYLRSLYQLFPTLKLGLFGRFARSADNDDTSYLKPAIVWKPRSRIMFSAFPNLDGDYLISGYYYYDSYRYFSMFYENNLLTTQINLNETGYLNYKLGYDYNDEHNEDRIYGDTYWYPFEDQHAWLKAGVSNNRKYTGFLIAWNQIVTPGVEYALEYDNSFRLFSNEERKERFYARLRIDFANTGKRLAPADNSLINFARGGISGAIYDLNGNKLELEDVKVRINKRRLKQTGAGASFYISGLKPGVYVVEIDRSSLPIEYVPVQRSFTVEVARLVVTEVNFRVRTEYGIVGKVISSKQQPVPNVKVKVRDITGNRVAAGVTGQFGYYRVDGLAPGEYRLIATHVGDTNIKEPIPSMKVIIVDDYLFDQDITIPLSEK